MQTIILNGVAGYQPDSMIVALKRWVRSDGATCSARQVGDRLEVTLVARPEAVAEVSDGVVRFYVNWRRNCRCDA